RLRRRSERAGEGQHRRRDTPGGCRDRPPRGRRVLPVRPRPVEGQRGVATRVGDQLLAARPHRCRTPRRPAARRVLGRGQRLRRGSLDHQRRHRRGRAGPGVVGRPLRTLLLARPGRCGRQGPIRHACRFRRAPRTNGIHSMNSFHIDSAQIDTNQPKADALVLFGATGDLAKRKLFPALYRLERSGMLTVPVIGVARSDWTDDDFRSHAKESIMEHIEDFDPAVMDSLCKRMDLVQGDYSAETTWNDLTKILDKLASEVAVYYMAIPPNMFPTVAQKLASVDLHHRGRIVVEKPFGRDLESAIELNKTLHSVFAEDHIFRIDHYLGKEAVEDLLVFRFGNTLLEPVWNRNYVRSVQVTMSETIGVEGRGSFYDSVGAIRDVLQNHLLQVISLLALETPAGSDSGFLQDEKAKVIAAMRPMDPKALVRGQYVGYRDEPGVDPQSEV